MFWKLKRKLLVQSGEIKALKDAIADQTKKTDKLLKSNGIMGAKISDLMNQVQQRDRIIEDLRQ